MPGRRSPLPVHASVPKVRREDPRPGGGAGQGEGGGARAGAVPKAAIEYLKGCHTADTARHLETRTGFG
ncbi:hypothetical protein SCA03_10490 [Streptomyces cacaoi]|uniref:Uncharacterized protein n=1 Tax=Streptomyces cacaoi TaxID=1898 RepID=A0A4Y3QVQ1_STRCI|nr:hypothetical protein SCA03_10490 [Streptomyces cacaoi]